MPSKACQLQLLKNLSFFKGIPPDDLREFLRLSHFKTYKKGRSLFLKGDAADYLYVVCEGWVKLYHQTAQGKEAVVSLYTVGDVFGEAGTLKQTKYQFSCEVAEDSALLEIPASVIRAKSKDNVLIMERILSSCSKDIHRLRLEHEHIILMTTPQRVGCLLLQLSADLVGKGGTFTFPYDKSLAAQRLGIKPETFSRALTQLKPYGVRINGPEVTIDNFKQLKSYCCNHCSLGFYGDSDDLHDHKSFPEDSSSACIAKNCICPACFCDQPTTSDHK